MKNPQHIPLWSRALRVVLVIALLTIAPLYERAHIMPDMAQTSMQPMAHDASTGPMAKHPPAAQGAHDAACRILCFGWVQRALPNRSDGLTTRVILVLTPAVIAVLDGITPAPSDQPPKPTRFV